MIATILPWWARWLTLGAALAMVFLLGQIHGERIAGEAHTDYISKQAAQTVAIAKAQNKVVIDTQIEYVDRIKTVYIKGAEIEKQVPVFVTSVDNADCNIRTSFVRLHDAAWQGDDPGPAASADREPSGISLAEVAEVSASNAAICRHWREKALGLEAFYNKLKAATNVPHE